jgi:hypothetical protein
MADFGQINLCDRDKADPIRFEDLPERECFIRQGEVEADVSFWDIYIKIPKVVGAGDAVFNAVLINKDAVLKLRKPDDLVYRVEVTDITIKPDW